MKDQHYDDCLRMLVKINAEMDVQVVLVEGICDRLKALEECVRLEPVPGESARDGFCGELFNDRGENVFGKLD